MRKLCKQKTQMSMLKSNRSKNADLFGHEDA